MTITLETDQNGYEVLTLSDTPKYGSGQKALHTDHILISASTGEVFCARPNLPGLSRLGPAEAAMVEHYLRKRGVHEPVVFAGDTSPSG